VESKKNLTHPTYQRLYDQSAEHLYATVAERVVAAVLHAWRDGRDAHLVITGGRTGLAMAQAIDLILFRATNQGDQGDQNDQEFFKKVQSSKLWIWMSDERFLPLDSEDRSDTHLIAAFTKSANRLHFERVETPAHLTLAEAASKYAAALDQQLGTRVRFDAVLLSLGEDGHIASLFPGHGEQLDSLAAAVAIDNSPKPPAPRVSMGISRLSTASAIYIFALGESKRVALSGLLAGAGAEPVNRLRQSSPDAQIYFVTDLKI